MIRKPVALSAGWIVRRLVGYLTCYNIFMKPQKHPLSKEEFDSIFAKVPRLTVEVVIKTDDGIVMTRIPQGAL